MTSESNDESRRAQQGPQPGVDELLRALRLLERTCEPPIGVGAFDILYASAIEVVLPPATYALGTYRPDVRSGSNG